MQRIIPEPTQTLIYTFKDMFDKYLTPITELPLQAYDDIQSDIVDELMDEIESAQLITWEHDSDGDRPNYDNLRDWLKDYYLLEKK